MKKTTGLLLAFLLTLSVVGCSSDAPSADEAMEKDGAAIEAPDSADAAMDAEKMMEVEVMEVEAMEVEAMDGEAQ
jgi:PBP1b-binding outer membrane lipoprotein LpoB